MDFCEITINDKALFEKYIKPYNPQASEMSFTNIFMWREYYKFRYSIVNDLLCIVSFMDSGAPFAFMPAGKLNEENFTGAVFALKEHFKERGHNLQFRRVTSSELRYFREFVKSEDNIVYDRDNSDYVYLAENLIKLSGKKYDGKRNHIKRFKKLYEYRYIKLDANHIDECRRIMNDWCREKNCNCHRGAYCERHAGMELLNNYDALGCKGAIIEVNGRIEAFTVGELLNRDTAVIHIEKANNRIHGLYTFINQQFCENEWQDAVYVNREQDLGIEGIRKAKLSYNPVKMIDKYTVIID